MNPRCLSDSELLRHYDDLFRQHEATRELAERYANGGSSTQQRIEELELENERLTAENNHADGIALALETLADAAQDYKDGGPKTSLKRLALQEAIDDAYGVLR